jgi:hypothetical protein
MKLQQQKGLAIVLVTKLSYDLNISVVTQHYVPSTLMQDQCDDNMSTFGKLMHSGNKNEAFLNQIIKGDKK